MHEEEVRFAEQMTLGAVLLDSAALPALLPILGENSECFYFTIHKSIYAAILDLFKENKPIDPLSVALELKKREAPGMISTIEKALEETTYIRDSTPTVETAEYYASLVREYSQRRRLRRIGAEIQRLSEDEDCAIDDLIAQSSAKIISVAGSRETEEFDLAKALDNLENETRDKMSGKAEDRVFSGFPELDAITGGFVKGEVTIIAGRTSVGKSSLVQAFVLHLLSKETPVIVFLLEMTETQLLARMLSSITSIRYTDIALGKISQEQFEKLRAAKGELSSKPLYIYAKSATVKRMSLLTQKFMYEQKRDCVAVIDYLQLVQSSNPKATLSLYEQTSEIAVGVKTEIAVNLGIPVLAVSQLSRRSEYTSARASIADLRNSGMIEENAGLILLIHKPPEEAGFFDKLGDVRAVDVEIAKNRLGGTGQITLGFEPEILKFSEF